MPVSHKKARRKAGLSNIAAFLLPAIGHWPAPVRGNDKNNIAPQILPINPATFPLRAMHFEVRQ
jgi:hypothetical protein